MAKPRKGKIKVRQKAALRKKSEAPADKTRVDNIPKMQAQMPRTTGAVLKIKVKKK